MARNMESSRDPRVDFYPDGWQRQLLDAVDNRESALIVASTSAGKTFISFYAMKEVLQENKQAKAQDRGFVVCVCPSKALVQQTAAEVYKRYGDIVGTFTRDRKHKLNDCQVLVTVPECLDILLLNPSYEHALRDIR